MRKKLKRLPIPEEKLSILSDWNVPTIDRVELAEQCRKTYDYFVSDMVQFMKSSYATYNGLCRVLQSENEALIARLRSNEISIQEAVMKVDHPERTKEYPQYHFIERVNKVSEETIYQDAKHILYRYEQNVFLGVVCSYHEKAEMQYGLKERLYLLDDTPYIIDTITNLLKNGYTIDKSATVRKKGEMPFYKLTHYIMSAYSDVPLDAIKKATVSMKQVPCSDRDIRDLRICNLRCKAVPNRITPEYTCGFVVQRYPNNEIKIINQNTGVVVSADYSGWLYDLLQDKKDYLKLQSRDNRLCVPVCGSIEYLYHICVAVDLYGVPHDEGDLGKKMVQFRSEYLSQRMQVDHLDNDCNNNRLRNLIVMTQSQHSKKQSLEADMKNLGLPYFCWAERYDATAVMVRAGILDVLKSPCYRLHGVFSISEYLTAADQFAHAAREECAVNKAVRALEDEECENNG